MFQAITPERCTVGDHFVAQSRIVERADDWGSCCEACAEQTEHPGKFAGDVLALILHTLSMDSAEDDFMSCEGWGYAGRFGRFILTEDTQGFCESHTYRDEAAAERDFQRWYDEGMGWQEDDATISYESRGVAAYFAGKHLGTFETERRARAAVSVEMRRQGFYPNVWLTGEHGPTIRRVDVW